MRGIVAAGAVAALTGCGVGMPEPLTPLTPEQSRAQVIEAATDIVSTLNLPVLRAAVWHGACHDNGAGPFRGQMRIYYPLAANAEQSEAEIAEMVAVLVANGWSGDPDFRSHSPVVTKNNVTAIFRGQIAGVSTRGIEVLGECRDVTTAGHLDHATRWVSLR